MRPDEDDLPAPGTSVEEAADPSSIPADHKDGEHVQLAHEAERGEES
jgi:hypothetical protein